MPPPILVTGLVVAYFVTERGLREGRGARFTRSRFDRGSTLFIIGSFVVAISLPPLLNELDVGRLGTGREAVAWGGVGLAACGIAFRSWAARTLGRFYTRTLVVEEGQRIVRVGPYRLLRHPGYLGTVSTFAGVALGRGNWLAALAAIAALGTAFAYRIRSEERMLAETFGEEYAEYAAGTWRLVPLVW